MSESRQKRDKLWISRSLAGYRKAAEWKCNRRRRGDAEAQRCIGLWENIPRAYASAIIFIKYNEARLLFCYIIAQPGILSFKVK